MSHTPAQCMKSIKVKLLLRNGMSSPEVPSPKSARKIRLKKYVKLTQKNTY